jgi:hypothetical protein
MRQAQQEKHRNHHDQEDTVIGKSASGLSS